MPATIDDLLAELRKISAGIDRLVGMAQHKAQRQPNGRKP